MTGSINSRQCCCSLSHHRRVELSAKMKTWMSLSAYMSLPVSGNRSGSGQLCHLYRVLQTIRHRAYPSLQVSNVSVLIYLCQHFVWSDFNWSCCTLSFPDVVFGGGWLSNSASMMLVLLRNTMSSIIEDWFVEFIGHCSLWVAMYIRIFGVFGSITIFWVSL